ncbi:hypothetical protein [Endozoicomonas arenosclerae]|uniref:hypothetical protein n=1 Tax=Endozoicomonas arenosclerae TaxID=1633495 RepID=UPI0007825F4F|nr:hypothetical protein [Endozoicomonas arenosclerae]
MYVVDSEVDSHHALVQAIYDKIIQVSSRVLRSAQTFNIDILKLEDPSYTEMAASLEKVCNLIEHLIKTHDLETHEWTLTKARDYTEFVANVAKAIAADDEVELERLTKEMNTRSFL